MVLIMGKQVVLMDLPWSLAFVLHNEGWYMELRVYPQIKNGLSENHSVVTPNSIRLIMCVLASHLDREKVNKREGEREGGEEEKEEGQEERDRERGKKRLRSWS